MKKGLKILSIVIPTVLTLLIINFLFGIVPLEKIQGLPLIFPFILCPIGALLAFVAYKSERDKLSLFGILFNLLLFIFPILYNVIVTMTQGA